ncbi:MAG: hypothetical protein WKF71_02985 [Pyrinomonadaceae bacterium]
MEIRKPNQEAAQRAEIKMEISDSKFRKSMISTPAKPINFMHTKLRIVIAEDERPARFFLKAILAGF